MIINYKLFLNRLNEPHWKSETRMKMVVKAEKKPW